jgi:hypothetical protein
MEAPGNMVLVEGDREFKTWSKGLHGRVDDWLYELVDGMIFYAAGRMKEHAPGGIKDLVDIDLVDRTATDAFEGIAGVEPDLTEETFSVGLGSDPADFPVFVEVGTGIYGEVGEPISTIPGHLMGPIYNPKTGGVFYASVIRGQPAQHYAREAFEELVERTPVVIKTALPELGRRR